MELHRLDGLSTTGLDNLDIQDIDFEMVDDQIYEIGSLETLEGLGTTDNKEITHEIMDEHGNVVMYADAEENLYMLNGLKGFFKKIGRGLKKVGRFVKRAVIKPIGKAAKFVGKKVLKPAFKFVNRFLNPVTILLRNGFLLAMKINMFKVAERLRFGYLSDSEARKRGMNMQSFAKLKKIVGKAGKIYEGAGGKSKNLRKAILNGKGNKDKAVPLNGFGLGMTPDLDPTNTFTDDFERFVVEADADIVQEFVNADDGIAVEGLGAIASSSAIAAASGAVGGVAALLKNVTGVFNKANTIKDEVKKFIAPFNPKNTPAPGIPTRAIKRVSRFVPNTSREGKILRRRFPPTPSFNPAFANQNVIAPQEEGFLKKHGKKVAIGVGVVAIGTAIYFATRSKKTTSPQTKPINGLPKKTKTRDELGRFVGASKRRKTGTTSRKRKTTRNRLPKKFVPKALL